MKIKSIIPHSFMESRDMGTCDTFAGCTRPYISSDLIPDRAWHHMLPLLKHLPGELALNRFVLETSLGSGGGPVDFSIHLSKRMMGPKILLSVARKKAVDGDEIWEDCQRIALIWQDENSALGKYVDDIWLEFDLFSDHPGSPSLFFKTMNAGPEKFQKIFNEISACIKSPGFTEVRKKILAQCLNAVVGDGRITWFGIMLPRPESMFRLCLYWPESKAISCLKDLGYPFFDKKIATLNTQLNQMFNAVCLNVDISETMGNRIGFECFSPPTTYDQDARGKWEEALKEFVTKNWCTPEKYEAVLGYPGHAMLSGNSKNWPPSLKGFCRENHKKMESCFIRRLSHFKIGYTPGQSFKAKVYLAANHVWINK